METIKTIEGPAPPDPATEVVEEELETGNRIIIALSGSIGTGKSTLCGHLLFDLNVTPSQTERKIFESTKDFRYFIQTEKEVGNPQHGGTCFIKHFTEFHKNWTLIDCPGKNIHNESKMASMANVVMIVVSVNDVSVSKFLNNILAHYIYSPQYIILVNQMDLANPPYSEKSFIDSLSILTKELSDINLGNCPIIPISGKNGDNLTTKSELMPWWEGYIDKTTNHTIYHVRDLLEHFLTPPQHKIDAETRIAIYRDYPKIKILGGYLISGGVKSNDTLYTALAKDNIETKIQSLRLGTKVANSINAGDHGSISLTQFDLVRKGSILLTKFDIINQQKQQKIIADITIYHPTIRIGCIAVMSVHTIILETKLIEFISKISPNQEINVPSPKELLAKERARVIITPTKEFLLDCELSSPYLGRITGFLGGKVGFNGKIVDIELSDGKRLSKLHKWARVRLLLIACFKDRNHRFPCPREIIIRIAYYLWVMDYAEPLQ